MRKTLAAFLLLLTLTIAASAKSWRGIVPLRSTRSEVEKILGKPSGSDHVYKIGAGTVDITYSQQRCTQNVVPDWGNWNVSPDTVLTMSFEADLPVRELKIRNLERYKLPADDPLTTYYRLPAEGIQYSVKGGRVVKITYGPTDKDKTLRCAKTMPN